MGNQQELVSPRLQALQEKLTAGDTGAIDAFWRAIQTSGAPLVESIDNSKDNVLATFMWRAEEQCAAVLIFGGVAHPDAMVRLGESNLWFKSYELPRDSRFTYELGPSNQPLDQRADGWDPSRAAWQLDPLNPKRCSFAHDDEGAFFGYTASLLELPDAPAQPWVTAKDHVPSGTTELHRYQSRLLQNERRLWIYTPPSTKIVDEPYDLLILFDGFVYSQIVPTPTILDNLLYEKRIRPTLAVMVDSPNRQQELTANLRFRKFMVDELIPWLRTKYPITADATRTTLGGSSAGGFAALSIALAHPDIFGNVLSQSGAFWFADPKQPNNFVEKVASLPPAPLSIYLDVGLFDPQNLQVNQKLRDILQEKDYDLHYHERSSGHEPVAWQGTLGEALLTLQRNTE
ncbi:MAG: alpha/beta hydrolase-fold protein [Caldilineaceae bacterium]